MNDLERLTESEDNYVRELYVLVYNPSWSEQIIICMAQREPFFPNANKEQFFSDRPWFEKNYQLYEDYIQEYLKFKNESVRERLKFTWNSKFQQRLQELCKKKTD